MAGTLVIDTLKSSTTSPPAFQNTNGTAIGTLCRAWANWTSAGVLNGSFNVSSITKVGTGVFTVNFTAAFADTNYAVTSAGATSATINGWAQSGDTTSGTKTTSSVNVAFITASSNVYDPYTANVAIFQ